MVASEVAPSEEEQGGDSVTVSEQDEDQQVWVGVSVSHWPVTVKVIALTGTQFAHL